MSGTMGDGELGLQPVQSEASLSEPCVGEPEADRSAAALSEPFAFSTVRGLCTQMDQQLPQEGDDWDGNKDASQQLPQEGDDWDGDEDAFWQDMGKEIDQQSCQGGDVVWLDAHAERLARAKALLEVAAECKAEADVARAELVRAEGREPTGPQKRQSLLSAFFPGSCVTPVMMRDALCGLRGRRGPVHPACQTAHEREAALKKQEVRERSDLPRLGLHGLQSQP